jgi:hypothetical protein
MTASGLGFVIGGFHAGLAFTEPTDKAAGWIPLANRPPIAINLRNPTAAPCLVVLQGLSTSARHHRNPWTTFVGSMANRVSVCGRVVFPDSRARRLGRSSGLAVNGVVRAVYDATPRGWME